MSGSSDEEMRKRLENKVQYLRQRASTVSFQLSTWVLLGNGGGLFFCLQLARDPDFTRTTWSTAAYLVFLGGIASSFASLVLAVRVQTKMELLFDNALHNALQVDKANEMLASPDKAAASPIDWTDMAAKATRGLERFATANDSPPRIALISRVLTYVGVGLLGIGLLFPVMAGIV